jgi:hypothetical protein
MSAMEEQRTEGTAVLKQGVSETARVRGDYDGGKLITSAALIGIGFLIEPELLAGMAIGAGIVVGLGWVGAVVGGAVRLVVRTAVRTGYIAVAQTRQIVIEATEGVQGMIGEARAAQEGKQPLQ